MTDHSFSSRPEHDAWTRRMTEWDDLAEAADEPADFSALEDVGPADGIVMQSAVASLSLPASARLVFPVHYEPTYAYPLILWFHDDGESERSADVALPRISERNYLGAALRGNISVNGGYGWSNDPAAVSQRLVDVLQVVSLVEELFAVHSDRIYLGGVGTGATTALQLFLQSPLHFAGAMCLGGNFAGFQAPLNRFRELRGKRLLLGTTVDAPAEQMSDMVATGRLLYAAGLQVATRAYPASGAFPTPKVLRDVDSWLMTSVGTAIFG